MRPEEIRRHGQALAERVRRDVDTSKRLDVMRRQHRRQRSTAYVLAAAAVIALIVGAVLFVASPEPPIVTEPPTTTQPQGLESLPVETFVVLVNDYTVDESTGTCAGSGVLADLGSGSQIHVWDESTQQSPQDAPTIALPDGHEVAGTDEGALFLFPSGAAEGCVFELPDLGYDIDQYEHVSLFPAADPDVAMSTSISGLRVVFTFGEVASEPGFDPSTLASEDPTERQKETRILRESAGPGRIAGFVSLGGSHHSDLAGSQPYCIGVAAFSDIRPGASVVVRNGEGVAVGESALRGSSYDAHEGCILWFTVDVPPDLSTYIIEIGGHPPVELGSGVLSEFGWIVNVWSDETLMQGTCEELEPESTPMTCILFEPPG